MSHSWTCLYTEGLSKYWLLVPLLVVYLSGLGRVGFLGPDEPRYASIGREMARSGDWVTPRLDGSPWFEKPPLLYWMTGAGYRLRLSDEWAARLPLALAHGDRVELLSAGAYVTTYASQRFNGFAPLSEHYI